MSANAGNQSQTAEFVRRRDSVWPEFFERGQANAEDQRIESCPGGIRSPGLKTTERDAATNGWILPGEKCS